MEQQDDTLICLLDVLGFENLFIELGLDTIEEKYKELISVADEQNIEFAIARGFNGEMVGLSPSIKSSYFSDTIIFWCKYDVYRREVLFSCMQELLCKSIEIGLPLRGSISVGQVRIDKERGVYLGQPIISAARAETAQKWIGITLSRTFNNEPYCYGFKLDNVLQYDKHLKKGSEDKVIPLVIDFPRHWRLKRSIPIIEQIQKLDRNKDYSDYYNNTIDFAKYSEEKHDWWTKEPEYIQEIERRKKKGEVK
jgi:hypothetical protein